jgi:hypothetical protein
VVPALPLLPAGPDVRPTEGDGWAAAASGAYHLRLIDLTREVLAARIFR